MSVSFTNLKMFLNDKSLEDILTAITGIGVYSPNGRETKRIGIIHDIEVKPTIEVIRILQKKIAD